MPSDIPHPRSCDLIMKGGITSGVIYPRLVAELAKSHQLRSVGGTSAGAIAAAGAAAAQYGRANGVKIKDDAGPSRGDIGPFEKLDKLPEELGKSVRPGQSRLLSFFSPQDATRTPFELLLLMIDKDRSALARLRGACWILFKQHWFVFLLVPLIVYTVSYFLERLITAYDLRQAFSITAAVLGFVTLGIMTTGIFAIRKLLLDLTQQNFGIATGMPPESAKSTDPLTLTPWLATYFNTLSGKPNDQPLTFGDLWGPPTNSSNPDDRKGRPENPVVDFQAVTTCLSLGRPYSLPLEDKDFYYSDGEWAKLFPPEVMTWLLTHERTSDTVKELHNAGFTHLHAMPEPCDWPVVIAVRMSLSFPVLLAAVPMYRINRGEKKSPPKPVKVQPIKVLFTDGGVSSNFPIHLFDSPFPSRPTFAVDLQSFPDTMTDPKERADKRVFTFIGNRSGHQQVIHEPPLGKPSGQVVWFVSRLIETMQNWRDQLPKSMAGYRDRIAYVQHTKDEGGLNLNMSEPLITALGNAGAAAAQKLTAAFYAPHKEYKGQTGWQNHQWIRMRSSLKQLDALIQSVSEKIESKYSHLPKEDAPAYAFSQAPGQNPVDQLKALALLQELENLAARMKALQGDLAEGAPESKLAFRITPEW